MTVLKKAEITLVTDQKMVTTPETALTMAVTQETMETQATTVMPETMEMTLTAV